MPYFQLAYEGLGEGYAMAGIVKDAGDDPDVTHGATIISTVFPAPPGTGIQFRAGEGVAPSPGRDFRFRPAKPRSIRFRAA